MRVIRQLLPPPPPLSTASLSRASMVRARVASSGGCRRATTASAPKRSRTQKRNKFTALTGMAAGCPGSRVLPARLRTHTDCPSNRRTGTLSHTPARTPTHTPEARRREIQTECAVTLSPVTRAGLQIIVFLGGPDRFINFTGEGRYARPR